MGRVRSVTVGAPGRMWDLPKDNTIQWLLLTGLRPEEGSFGDMWTRRTHGHASDLLRLAIRCMYMHMMSCWLHCLAYPHTTCPADCCEMYTPRIRYFADGTAVTASRCSAAGLVDNGLVVHVQYIRATKEALPYYCDVTAAIKLMSARTFLACLSQASNACYHGWRGFQPKFRAPNPRHPARMPSYPLVQQS